MARQSPSLLELRENLRAWTRTRLWAQVLVGLVLGIGVGALLGPDLKWVTPQVGEIIGQWLAIPGRVFLGLISLVLVPLVSVSIIQGITGREAASFTRDMLDYGTRVVAGVTPGKGGQQVHGVPVHDTVRRIFSDPPAPVQVVCIGKGESCSRYSSTDRFASRMRPIRTRPAEKP